MLPVACCVLSVACCIYSSPATQRSLRGHTGLTAWVSGGVVTEVKEPREVSFQSLAERVRAPGALTMAGDHDGICAPSMVAQYATQWEGSLSACDCHAEAGGLVLTDLTFSNVETQIHVAIQATPPPAFSSHTCALTSSIPTLLH